MESSLLLRGKAPGSIQSSPEASHRAARQLCNLKFAAGELVPNHSKHLIGKSGHGLGCSNTFLRPCGCSPQQPPRGRLGHPWLWPCCPHRPAEQSRSGEGRTAPRLKPRLDVQAHPSHLVQAHPSHLLQAHPSHLLQAHPSHLTMP